MPYRPPARRLIAASTLVLLAGALAANAEVTESRKLAPSDGTMSDAYAFAADIEGDIGVIGAWFDDQLGAGVSFQVGSCYVVNTTTGQELTKFQASDAELGGGFGTCVDIQGNLVAIGARAATGFTPFAGAVYLFDITDPAHPVELSKIAAADGAAFEYFGTSVAIAGNNLVVGAPSGSSLDDLLLDVGAIYVYDITDPANPAQRFKINAPFPAIDNEFGINVAAEGNIALVGEWWSDVEEDAQVGSAHLYDLANGQHLARIEASDPSAGDEFGVWGAISGNIAVIGTRNGDGVADDTGAAYQFDITNPAAPVEVRKIFAADGAVHDEFGRAVDISGNTIVVGSGGFDRMGFSSAGAAYLFDATTGAQIEKLVASDPGLNDSLGNAVCLNTDASTALIGAWGDDSIGSAYVYDLAPAPTCPADLDNNQAVDVFDLLAYLDLWFNADPAAERTNDTPAAIDVFDLLAYLDTWFAGC